MLLLPLFHWFGAPIGSMTVHEKDKVRSGWQKKTPAVALAPNRLPRTITACKLSLRRGQQRYASERPLGGTVVCAQVDGRDVVEPRPPGRLVRGARVVDVLVNLAGGGERARDPQHGQRREKHLRYSEGIRVVDLVSVYEEERKNCKNYKFCEKQCRARKVACKNSAGPRRVRSTPWAARTSLAPRRAPRRRRDSAYHTSVRRSSDCAGSDR